MLARAAGSVIARLVAHNPDKGQVLQRYYGYYANRTRGERRKAAEAGGASPVDAEVPIAEPAEISGRGAPRRRGAPRPLPPLRTLYSPWGALRLWRKGCESLPDARCGTSDPPPTPRRPASPHLLGAAASSPPPCRPQRSVGAPLAAVIHSPPPIEIPIL